jgi:hypothetical protein
MDNPRNVDSPENFADYSLGLTRMAAVRAITSRFRATCNMVLVENISLLLINYMYYFIGTIFV